MKQVPDPVDAAIASTERVVNGRIGLPSGRSAMVSLPLAMTDADLLTVIFTLPNLLAQARAQNSPIVLARAPLAKQ